MVKKYDFIIFGMGYDWIMSAPPTTTQLKEAGKDPDQLLDSFLPRPFRNFGHYKIASFLRKRGFTVKCIDFLFSYSDDEIRALVEKYVSPETLAIGFTVMFGNLGFEFFQNQFLKRVELIKSIANKKVIFGGKLRSDFVERNRFLSAADLIVYNESERVILKALTDLKNTGNFDLNYQLNKEFDANKVCKNGNEENSDLCIFLNEDDDMIYGEPMAMEIARGCIFNCSFCNYPLRGKAKTDFNSDIAEFKNTLINNYERYGISLYNIVDSTFNDSTEKLQQLADVINSLSFKPRFFAFLKPDLLIRFPEQIKLLKEIGVVLGFFGIETIHPPALRTIKKNSSKDELVALFSAMKQEMPNISIHCNLVAGLPYETREIFISNLQQLMEHRNVIDSISVAALVFSNEEMQDPSSLSEFTKDSSMHGYSKFYDPAHNRTVWTNSTNNLTYDSALALSAECNELLYDVNKNDNEKGPSFWRVYETFWKENPSVTPQKFVQLYKQKVLS